MPRLFQAATFDRTISPNRWPSAVSARKVWQASMGSSPSDNIQVTNGSSSAAPQARRATTAKQASKSRKRRSFSQTADELILSMLKRKPMITGDINAAWKRAPAIYAASHRFDDAPCIAHISQRVPNYVLKFPQNTSRRNEDHQLMKVPADVAAEELVKMPGRDSAACPLAQCGRADAHATGAFGRNLRNAAQA